MIDKTKFISREILAILFWVYVILKLFIFDIDNFLFQKLVPDYAYLPSYKYFFIIPGLSFYWILTGNQRFFRNVGYVIFYPLIISLWKIPRTLFERRSWFLIFTYFNSAIAFLKSLKINLLLLSFFSIGAILVLKSPNNYLIIFGIVILLGVLLYHYYQKFYFAFKPTTAFAVDSDTLQTSLESEEFSKHLLNEVSNSENEENSEVQIDEEKEGNENKDSLEQLVLYNGIFRFIASRLKNFQRSKIYISFFVIGLVFTLIFTSVILTLINYSLFRLDPSSFTLNEQPSLLLFFYYSFNTIFSNQIYEVIPAASLTRVMNMVGIFLNLLILAILVSIYFSTKSERYKEELDKMIITVDEQSHIIEGHISRKYSLSFEQALEELKNIESAFYRFLYHLTKGIN